MAFIVAGETGVDVVGQGGGPQKRNVSAQGPGHGGNLGIVGRHHNPGEEAASQRSLTE